MPFIIHVFQCAFHSSVPVMDAHKLFLINSQIYTDISISPYQKTLHVKFDFPQNM